jgi:outer membrane protein
MRKLMGLILFAVATSLVSASALADINVAVVDVNRVMEQSPQAQALSQQLQEEFEPAQNEMREMQSRMQTLQNRLERDADVMSTDERRDAEREARDIQRTLQRRQNDLAEDFNARRNEALGSLQRLIMSEVQAYARDNGLDLVLGDGVFYASSQVDITDAILDRLRQRDQD